MAYTGRGYIGLGVGAVINGSGPPASTDGNDGDFYIDVLAATIYGPKAAGAWGSSTALAGPTGPAGPAGGTPFPQRVAIVGRTALQTVSEFVCGGVDNSGAQSIVEMWIFTLGTLTANASNYVQIQLYENVSGTQTLKFTITTTGAAVAGGPWTGDWAARTKVPITFPSGLPYVPAANGVLTAVVSGAGLGLISPAFTIFYR